MALAEFQGAVAILYRSAEARRDFRAAPDATGARLGLSSVEIAALNERVEEIERFANALICKRLGEIRKWLPRTFAALGGRAEAVFREFHERFDGDGRSEAVAFAREVAGTARGDDEWLRDVARFESQVIRMQRGRIGFAIFGHRPADLIAGAALGRRGRQMRWLWVCWRLGERKRQISVPLLMRAAKGADRPEVVG